MPIMIPDIYATYKIIGIDPGLSNTGVAIYEIASNNNQILSIEAFTVHVDKLPNDYFIDMDIYKERVSKLYKLKKSISEIVASIQPASVACESPFYSHFRPMAYGSLVETLSFIRDGVIEVNPSIYFDTIEPLLIKKMVGAGSTKGKLDVTKSISNIPVIMNILRNDLSTLDEHSIDAIAIGYSFLKKIGAI